MATPDAQPQPEAVPAQPAAPPQVQQAPPTVNYDIGTPILIDAAGLNQIADALRPVLGELSFTAKSSVGNRFVGNTLEEVTAKDKYGTAYVRELWILQRNGQLGVYLDGESAQVGRAFLRINPQSVEAYETIRAVIQKYKAPYWYWVNHSMVQVVTLPIVFMFLGWLLSYLLRRPHEVVQEATRAFGSTPSADPTSKGAGSAPIVPSAKSWWFDFFKGMGIFAVASWIAHYVLLPLRPLWEIGFPRLAFDLPPNAGRNDSAKRFRWVFAGTVVTGFMAGLLAR